jgi:hypothetical protein
VALLLALLLLALLLFALLLFEMWLWKRLTMWLLKSVAVCSKLLMEIPLSPSLVFVLFLESFD